uniref:C2H2-type domain-containing protein n=1 Tax=Romanomermis culicivorax TaxID=13658 RepID=A0A915KW41_ROMCU
MELEEETRLSHDSTKTAEQEPNFSEVIAESCPAAAEKSENARNLTPISMPPTILETACSPDNQRHRRKFSSLVSQEQQQFFIKNSSGKTAAKNKNSINEIFLPTWANFFHKKYHLWKKQWWILLNTSANGQKCPSVDHYTHIFPTNVYVAFFYNTHESSLCFLGSVGTPSRLTVRRRPSSSTVYSMRASSSSPFPHYPIAQLTTVPADVSPLYPTSDLGSSPRSSFSTITTAGSSSASSSITDGGGRFSFSKEMTPQDATVAVVSSACMVYSPAAPFSPFIVSPNEDATKTAHFLTHGSRDSAAILQEKNSSLSISDQKTSETSPAALISDRERSRSDSDVINSGGQKSKYTGTSGQQGSNAPPFCSLTPSAAVQKKIFKKQILERYQTESLPMAHDKSIAARDLLSSSCSPLLAQLSFFPHFANTAAAPAGDNKSIQDTNFFDLSLPPCIVETESQAVKTLEQCSILEFMLKNQLFASLAFRQDSVISSSSSTPLSPFRAADAAGKSALSSSAVGIFNRAPCLTLPTTPVATKIDQSSSVEDNSINKRSRSESDMSLKAPLAFRSMTTEQTLTSLLDESHTSSTTTIKSHKCAVCQKAFGRSDMLTRHMRLHTGIKFVCIKFSKYSSENFVTEY